MKFSLVYTLPATQLAPPNDNFIELAGTTTEYIARLKQGASLPNLAIVLCPWYLVPKKSATFMNGSQKNFAKKTFV
jgi:hypothetical protein